MKGNMNIDAEVNATGNVQAEFEDEAIQKVAEVVGKGPVAEPIVVTMLIAPRPVGASTLNEVHPSDQFMKKPLIKSIVVQKLPHLQKLLTSLMY
jgi:hypothetical protein